MRYVIPGGCCAPRRRTHLRAVETSSLPVAVSTGAASKCIRSLRLCACVCYRARGSPRTLDTRTHREIRFSEGDGGAGREGGQEGGRERERLRGRGKRERKAGAKA
jgi:hypothetical protein